MRYILDFWTQLRSGVDIPIHLYSLYSDLKHDWTNVYASQEQVLEYWEGLIDRYRMSLASGLMLIGKI